MISGHDRTSWQKRMLWAEGSVLPSGAKLVALVVSVYTDPTGGQGVWLSVPDLGRLTGLSHPTVRRYLAMLTGAGWLRDGEGARFLDFPGELAP